MTLVAELRERAEVPPGLPRPKLSQWPPELAHVHRGCVAGGLQAVLQGHSARRAATVIRPSWETFEPASGDVVVTVDPGRAFGTGTYEARAY